jgi:hypothetical protein
MAESRVTENSRVEIELVSKNKSKESLSFVLVPDDAADFDKGRLGLGTPLAKAILGHGVGETLEYKRGDIVQVRIVSVEESAESVAPDAGEEREETLRRARERAELESMVSFALTFDSKWGDYDPEQIVKQYEENAGQKSDKPSEGAGNSDAAKEEEGNA